MFLLQSLPRCRPAEYEGWLRDRGLEPFDAQDRVVRGREPFTGGVPSARALTVERVGPETQDEWSAFLQRVYRLHTGPWLQKLIGRRGWHQYVVRVADRDRVTDPRNLGAILRVAETAGATVFTVTVRLAGLSVAPAGFTSAPGADPALIAAAVALPGRRSSIYLKGRPPPGRIGRG